MLKLDQDWGVAGWGPEGKSGRDGGGEGSSRLRGEWGYGSPRTWDGMGWDGIQLS